MEEFPSNAHSKSNYTTVRPGADKEEAPKQDKKVERVTTGDVVRRKKPLGKRLVETFIGGDVKGVFGYVVMEVLIPAAKDMAVDAVREGLDRVLFPNGGSPSRRSGGRGSIANYVNYNRFGGNAAPARREEPRRDPRRDVSRRARSQHDFDEIILATRVEAEEVIDRLFDLISKYEAATVADLYGLVDISASYTDDKWGWTNIQGAGVTRVRNGYLLDLPKPEPLD